MSSNNVGGSSTVSQDNPPIENKPVTSTSNYSSETESRYAEPGGLFGYIQSRKKVQQQNNNTTSNNTNPNRMKYHKLANIGASNYLIDVMSDSDDDEPVSRDSAMSPPPIFDTPSIDADLTRESWFSRFQKKSSSESKIKNKIEREDSSSWMSKAMRSVDDATTKASDWISNQTDSTSNWALSSITSYLPSISWSPFFKDNNAILSSSNDDESDQNNTLAFLPRMASRAKISFATKGRNPFQAVIGRDTDYLLSSNTAYFWGLSGGNSWLSWIRNKTLRLIEATDETYQKATERPKSQPSEASIQAVKNLLMLVETETTEFKRLPTNSSDTSSHSSLEAPFQHNPIEGFPDIHLTPKGTAQLSDTEDDPPPFKENLSFDSCTSSYASQSSPVRSSPVRPEPCIRDNDTGANDEMKSNPNNARNAEMASRLAEGTLRAYR